MTQSFQASARSLEGYTVELMLEKHSFFSAAPIGIFIGTASWTPDGALRCNFSRVHFRRCFASNTNAASVKVAPTRPLPNRQTKFGGEGGIRTPGPLLVNGFQDRRIRPLCHLSGARILAFSGLENNLKRPEKPQNKPNFMLKFRSYLASNNRSL